MIHVVGRAEEELQIGPLCILASAQENSGFGDIGNERAALQKEIADDIGALNVLGLLVRKFVSELNVY